MFHISDLEPWIDDDRWLDREDAVPPEPEVVDGHLEYEVDDILDEWFEGDDHRYLVKYKGYDEPEWQPAEVLTNVGDILRRWRRRRRG